MKSLPLYPYMERVDKFTKDKPQIGMFVFYGGGKTYMSLKWLERLYLAHKPIFPVLVLTMGTLVSQWGDEIEKHCSRKYILIEGNTKKRIKASQMHAEIYVVNYDAVRSPTLLQVLRRMHFKTVIADESVMLKEARTARFKTWRKLLKDTPFRALLTAKPILERPEDVWAQMLFLDEGQTLGTSFWKFRDTYFHPGPPWDPYKWELKEDAGKEIAQLMNRKCIQIKKEEIADQLPPKIYNTVEFNMPKETRKLYVQLKEEFAVTYPSGERYETQWAMAKASKLHQLSQGFIYLPTWEEKHDYHVNEHALYGGSCYVCILNHRSILESTPSKDTLCWEKVLANWEDIDQTKLNWLEENLPLILSDGPVLIWSCFRAMQYRIAKLLGKMKIPFGCLRSKLTQHERALTTNGFSTGKYNVLLLSQQTAALGLNLQRANNAIFTCSDFKAALRENAEGRCHRLGSEIHEQITYWDLITKNSIDVVVRRAHKDKLNVAEAILAYMQKG